MVAGRIRFLLLVCIGICLSMLSQVLAPARALAFVDPITVTAQSDTVSFPKGIDFQMSAHDTISPITSAAITIIYKDADYQEQQPVTIATPSQAVTLHWHLDVTEQKFLPAGAQVSYSWELHDRAGNSHTDVQQNFQVLDTRFSWQHLSAGSLEVNWYNRSTDFGQTILNQASDEIKHIGDDLGGGIQHPVNVWIYQTDSDFRGALPPGTYEWVGGIAFPAFNQASFVVDSLNDDALTRAMPHELTHIVFHQLISPDLFAPRWFDEGLAVYHQIYHEPEMALRFKQALSTHTLLRLNTLAVYFPSDSDQAFLAYAQSWKLVDYMYTTFGKTKLNALIKAMNSDQQNFDQDLTQTIGMDTAHLENQWRLDLKQPATLASTAQSTPTIQPVSKPMPVPVTTDSNAPLLLLLGAFLVIFPVVGLGGLFAYQYASKKRESAWAAIQAQYRANNSPSYYAPPVGSVPSIDSGSYPINPGRYTDPRSYQSAPRGYAYMAPGHIESTGVGGEIKQQRTLVDLPAIRLSPPTPAPPVNTEASDDYSENVPFTYTQEYSDRSPRQPRSQE
ncbi:MAG TPA: peptidase MA family metallohydrolase [Ktedonosporobacter sp.]|nr:peptidase MA family metallohydrolase [Ktedonosporobacter sp.]